MIFPDFFIALFVTFILVALFGGSYSRGGGLAGAWVFALLLLFFVWAAGAWLRPVGPLAWGVPWVGFAFAGFAVVLLLAALAPPQHRHAHAHRAGPAGPPHEGHLEHERHLEEQPSAAVSFWVWLLLAFLIAALFARYSWY